MNDQELLLSPVDFIALVNQTLDNVFGRVSIQGELSNFRISKNKWMYFDLKDEYAKVSCFASIYALPGPLTDGMIVKITGTPRLHPQFGFSITAQTILPAGEGSINKALLLLKQKLTTEGLFDDSRKRLLPTIPRSIVLVASTESAAYADFIKIMDARWPYVEITVFDTQVQGEAAPEQLAAAIKLANEQANTADVLVVTRGGGSNDDLQAFNDERVVRALAASRIPTLVAIGHEVDESFAELVADKRASTPSNAAELLVPDRHAELKGLAHMRDALNAAARGFVDVALADAKYAQKHLIEVIENYIQHTQDEQVRLSQLLEAYNPKHVLRRGYSLVKSGNAIISSVASVAVNDKLQIELADGQLTATVNNVRGKLKT